MKQKYYPLEGGVENSLSLSCLISSKSQYINLSSWFSSYVGSSPEICESGYDGLVFEKVLCATAACTKICVRWDYYFICICRTICYLGCVVDTVAFIKVSLQVLGCALYHYNSTNAPYLCLIYLPSQQLTVLLSKTCFFLKLKMKTTLILGHMKEPKVWLSSS